MISWSVTGEWMFAPKFEHEGAVYKMGAAMAHIWLKLDIVKGCKNAKIKNITKKWSKSMYNGRNN